MPSECQTRSEKLGVLDRVTISRLTPQTAGMNADAFGVFYDRTARPLWAYLLRVSGDRDTADDLLQESYCRMLAVNLPAMSEAGRKSYLFRTATNLLRDRWRHSQVVNRLAALTEACEGRTESPDVQRAFEQLKPGERELLWLAYVEGCSHEDIGSITGLRTSSIRVLLFRARKKLAAALRLHGTPRSGKE
ncbi:MAG TPA: sigma-70 family RNA polymerase sigma factor [Candidatus Acidoferrales bacterium]|nr:sigma-70 family RNA polymerase sigma factor [Candidatus Acidoferrales bacterium]